MNFAAEHPEAPLPSPASSAVTAWCYKHNLAPCLQRQEKGAQCAHLQSAAHQHFASTGTRGWGHRECPSQEQHSSRGWRCSWHAGQHKTKGHWQLRRINQARSAAKRAASHWERKRLRVQQQQQSCLLLPELTQNKPSNTTL